jgi:3-oxoacyl-[acyl-carrier protein] reductase
MTTRQPIPPYVPGHNLLKSKTALITAAAGAGIGLSTAKKMAEEGVSALVISDVHEKRLAQAVETIEKETGLKAYGQLCNVTKEDDVQALVNFAIEKMGHVDILVNNAGLGTSNKLLEMTDDQWNLVLDVTLNGTFRMTRAMLKHMSQRGKGVIVNNASVLGWRAQVEQSHYAAAKAGVMAFTRCAAMEAAEFGVRINAVSPSLAVHEFLRKSAPADFLAELEGREAFGRGAETWEIANVIVFLASDYSSYMTGEVVSVSSQRA